MSALTVARRPLLPSLHQEPGRGLDFDSRADDEQEVDVLLVDPDPSFRKHLAIEFHPASHDARSQNSIALGAARELGWRDARDIFPESSSGINGHRTHLHWAILRRRLKKQPWAHYAYAH